MTLRSFPHQPSVEALSALEDRYLQDLVNFRTVRDHALEHSQPSLIGDFGSIAMGLSWLAWWRGRDADVVAAFTGDALAIALSALQRRYVFRSPYDYWLLCCAAVATEHPATGPLLSLPASQWSRTPLGTVTGMLPGLVKGLAAAAGVSGDPEASARSVQQLLRTGLDSDEDKEEALRFAPAVGALAAIQTGREQTWHTASAARRDGWLAEAQRFPDTAMFLLDWEWLALSRLARDADFAITPDAGATDDEPDCYRPIALLDACLGQPGTLGDRLGPPG